LVVAGDAVYNGVHQYLAESANGGIQKWIDALDSIAALQPRSVVASHKNPALDDDPKAIDETRAYLEDADRRRRPVTAHSSSTTPCWNASPRGSIRRRCGSGAPGFLFPGLEAIAHRG
jgi:hypothetical protein